MSASSVNGISIENLNKIINNIEKNPDLANFSFKAKNKWVDGTNNQARIMEFYVAGEDGNSRKEPLLFEEDEPPILLGNNKGANPVEYILIGLSGCLTTTLVAQAAAKGIKLKSVESQLEGDLDIRGFFGMTEEVRKGYKSIKVNFKIESDEPDEKIQELVELAQKYSPVFDIVTNKVPVNVEFEKK